MVGPGQLLPVPVTQPMPAEEQQPNQLRSSARPPGPATSQTQPKPAELRCQAGISSSVNGLLSLLTLMLVFCHPVSKDGRRTLMDFERLDGTETYCRPHQSQVPVPHFGKRLPRSPARPGADQKFHSTFFFHSAFFTSNIDTHAINSLLPMICLILTSR